MHYCELLGISYIYVWEIDTPVFTQLYLLCDCFTEYTARLKSHEQLRLKASAIMNIDVIY